MSKDQQQKTRQSGGVSIRIVGVCTTLIAVALAFFAFALSGYIADAEASVAADETRYVECSEAIDNLQTASDYLTSAVRMYVVTGRREYLDGYVYEYSVNNRRGKAVDVLRVNFGEDQGAVNALENALNASNGLARTELAALRLASDYYELEDVPEEVATANTDLFRSMPKGDERIEAAKRLVLSQSYDADKQGILNGVNASSEALLAQLDADLNNNKNEMQALLFQLRIAVALLLCVIMVFVLSLFMYVLKPLGHYVERLKENEPLEPDGAYELHYLANAYNTIYEDNSQRIEQLRQVAEQDALTGISNRVGYHSFLASHTRNIALILIDIDNFKEFNEVYGHDTGDAVLIKLAQALGTAFRSTDFPCRLEGDQFAVIMTNMNSELRFAILSKIELVNSLLAENASELPAVTLSVGAAFSTADMDDEAIYEAAHSALTQAKRVRTGNVVFYGETNEG